MDTFVAYLVLVVFVFTCLYFFAFRRKSNLPESKETASILVVVGSGGHTKEILTLMTSLGSHYSPRHYVIANTDKMSEEKVHLVEDEKKKDYSKEKSEYKIHLIPRSREVMQSWLSTVISTIYAVLYSIPLVFRINPNIILCNGPGTCIPVCLVGYLLKVLMYRKMCLIYVESICRVETLSLSGKILYYIADHMLVQWPELQQKYPRTKYIGRIV